VHCHICARAPCRRAAFRDATKSKGGQGAVWTGAFVTMDNVTFDSNRHYQAGAILLQDTEEGGSGNKWQGSLDIANSV
jgi:hypothetical protein